MKKFIHSLLGTAMLAVGLAANASAPPVPVLNWFSCAVGAQCAVAQVPLDYDEPLGAKTYIVLVKYPATDQANRIGSVFVNFGGPGVSGVNQLLSGFGQGLGFLLQGRFDVVSFDPRGVGLSDPLKCFDTMENRAAYFSTIPQFPYRDDQERHFFEVLSGFAPVCFERNLPIATHMSTADVARDLDLLRQAVGDEKLNYLGFSYGSYLGNTYANLFPDKIRTLVIDGVLNPRLWTIGRQVSEDRIALGEEFAEFLRLCDEAAAIHPAYCPASGPEGAGVRYHAMAEALKITPVVLMDGTLYTYDRLVADTTGCMYVPEDLWPYCAAVINYLSYAVQSVAGASEPLSAATRALAERLGAAAAGRAAYNNQFDASYGTMCADTQYLRPFSAYAALDGWTQKGSFFGPFWWWGNAACADWPLSPDRYSGPWTAHTSAPVLVVGNYYDGVTSYEGAVAATRYLKNARLLSYAGWGHTAFQRSECVREYVIGYLLEGSLPPEGTVCPANPNPFLPVAAAAPSVPGRTMDAGRLTIGLPPVWPGM
jgi:pimeloyl-ACP methyl ester carboxylesterase